MKINPLTNITFLSDDILEYPENALVVIDYLPMTRETENHIKLLRKAAQLNSLCIVILFQPVKEVDKSRLYRNFHHVFFLEKEGSCKETHRNCALIKSSHFKIQTSQLQFNQALFRFD